MSGTISFTTTPRNFLSDLNSPTKIGTTALGALTDKELRGVTAALKDLFKAADYAGSKYDTTATVAVTVTSGSLVSCSITV